MSERGNRSGLMHDTSDMPASHRYYFEGGRGNWAGRFDFELTDWAAFWADEIGIINRFLVLMMVFVTTAFGQAEIRSTLGGDPEREPLAKGTNEVRITKWGITLYLLRERYHLHPDGRCVTVDARERFGPIPLLISSRKAHPAEIHPDGRGAIYYMPLLGTDWIGTYDVQEQQTRIEATLTCEWAEATEVIHHVERS